MARQHNPGGCSPAVPPGTGSGDDVGGNLVFDEGDAVAQLQLPLLHPLQAQQVRCRRLMQGVDRGVEIAMLLLQPGEFYVELALILVGHGFSWLKRAIGPVEPLRRISSLRGEFATKLAPDGSFSAFRKQPVTGLFGRNRRGFINFASSICECASLATRRPRGLMSRAGSIVTVGYR